MNDAGYDIVNEVLYLLKLSLFIEFTIKSCLVKKKIAEQVYQI